jgi:hypothetical protein
MKTIIKIILLSIIIGSSFLINKTSVFACQPIPEGGLGPIMTLEDTIGVASRIVIVKWFKNGPITPDDFPNTSVYDSIKVEVVNSLKGSLKIGERFDLNTYDSCGYNQNFESFSGSDQYLLFLSKNNGPVIQIRKIDNATSYGLKQYKVVGENIDGLNITVDELKNKISGGDGIKKYSVAEFENFLQNNEVICDYGPETTTICPPYTPLILYNDHLLEGYVIKDEAVTFSCPRNSDGTISMCSRPKWHRFLIIGDSVNAKDGFKIFYGSYEAGEFKIGEKYIFTVKVLDYNRINFDSYSSASNLPISRATLLGNKDLKLGSNSPEVKILQEILNNNGFAITTSGAGSPGNESTYFGDLTKQALIRFQQKYNIIPAVGYFGTITREKIKSFGW